MVECGWWGSVKSLRRTDTHAQQQTNLVEVGDKTVDQSQRVPAGGGAG
jgi:hypothetical protein